MPSRHGVVRGRLFHTHVTTAVCARVQVLRFRAQAFTGGHKMSSQSSALKEGVDVAVCTSGRLQQLLDAGHLELNACQVRPPAPYEASVGI